MDGSYHLIRDADFVSFAFTAGLIFYIGIRASARHPTIEKIAKWVSALTFLTYVATAISVDGYEPLEWIASYIFRGGFLAGLVLGTFCFVGSFAARTWQFIAPFPHYFIERKAVQRRQIEWEARRQREAIEQQRKDEQLRRDHEEASRRTAEYQKMREEAARREAIEERRRIQARADCELCYSQHLNEVEYRLPKSIVKSFLRKYMSHDQPADEVEARGKQLQQIIQEHAHAANPPKKSNSMQELADWYLQEQSQIQSLPIEDEVRDFHLVQLNIRYSELTQAMLEKIEP
jgi:hypothetical protein